MLYLLLCSFMNNVSNPFTKGVNMFVKHCLPLACIGLLALNVVSAQEEVPQPEVPPRMIIDTQDASIWKGGSLDTTTVREGIPATIRWDHAKAPALRATTFPTDWTGPHNAIEFWLHSQSETRSSFMFIITQNSMISITSSRAVSSMIMPLPFMERSPCPYGVHAVFQGKERHFSRCIRYVGK